MKEQINNAIEWIKDQPIRGCITGSCLLDYFEGQDIDVFTYDEASFTEILYAMHHSPMFSQIDDLEIWKWEKYRVSGRAYRQDLITIKFMYNTCVEVNVIFKEKSNDAFSVLSSFDMDIICKAYDIQTKRFLDLSENLPDKKATWNRWNTKFYSGEVWTISRILRQITRCFKYHKRGYNTDLVVEKYIDLINKLTEYESVFNSQNFNDKLKVTKSNILIVKQLAELWLKTHSITDEQLEIINEKIREI